MNPPDTPTSSGPREVPGMTSVVNAFWEEFVSTGIRANPRLYEAFVFGDSEPVTRDLTALVLAGTKRATASLKWEYEPPAPLRDLPRRGTLSVVTDWSGHPQCVIESTNVAVVPFAEVTAEFAAIEGEGDGSLQFWQRVHWDYFVRVCEQLRRQPSERMLVVCESFMWSTHRSNHCYPSPR